MPLGRQVPGDLSVAIEYSSTRTTSIGFISDYSFTKERFSAVKVAILDGVLYIKGKNKMHKLITEDYKEYNIMSALVLRDFLYQI